MKRFIPFLFSLGVLITPQLGVMANETTTEAVNRDNQQLLSRAAHYQAWTLRGNEALEKGNYDRAIALYDQAIAIDGQQPLAWEQRGDALTQKGQYQAALEAYNEALNLAEEKQPQLQEKVEAIHEKWAQQLQG
ncbi:MAG: tetratricopeptide repeat protein [Cyanobacteria bacterium]|jgi:tetratricopeptide (TPR) repeat protein|nr:tetratricopeptide repeat protein [Cyanobacteria bacterium GSL.Bin1]